MICLKSCAVGLVFIFATIFMTLIIDKQKIFKDYVNSLNKEQLDKYNNIVNERKNISLNGYLLGLLLSLVFIVFNYNLKKISKGLVICLTSSIMFLTHYFYYILSPKTDWMVLHLDDKQRIEWLKVYRTMQFSYHYSLLIGVLSVMIISSAFKC
jgi:hypothetical protein